MAQRLQNRRPLREALIDCFLRRSEIANLNASTKVGKTYFALDMATAIVTGSRWCGYQTAKSSVIYLDNECHEETTDDRIAAIAEARGYTPEELRGLYVKNLRGRSVGIDDIGTVFSELVRENPELQKENIAICFLDAWYRFRTNEDDDENSNSKTAQAYNKLDALAQKLNMAFVLIHHTTKGNQALKATTDGGAGAGAQSRAADTHILIRPHQEPGCACVHAETRSFKRPHPFVVRWNYPLWTVEDLLDPNDLEMPKTTRKREKPAAAPDEPPAKVWTVPEFASQFITDKPQVRAEILLSAESAGISERQAIKLFQAVESMSTTHIWRESGLKKFANIPQPELLPKTPENKPKRKRGRPRKEK